MSPKTETQKPAASPLSMPNIILRIEGVTMLAVAIAAYVWLHGSWWLFALLLLAPDLSMLGYLAGPRTGSVVYNFIHMLLLPAVVIALGVSLHSDLAAQIGLIWLAHIGMDRTLGFGIKYPTFFQDTHLQHV